jgi:branched-chain amino acid transport system permease protein
MKLSTNLLAVAGLALVFVVIQGLILVGVINPYVELVLQYVCIFVIYALGLNLIYGFTGQFSLGHAAFYGIGAYTAALLTKIYLPESVVTFPVALLIGGLVSALVSFLIGFAILRLGSDYLGIATLGFGIIVKVLFDNADQVLPAMGGARGLTGITKYTTFAWAFLLAALVIILIRNLVYSSPGRACLAVREDEIAANTMGVSPFRYKMLAFVGGAFLAGVAGGLYAHLYVFVHPSNFDFLKSIDVLMVVVLGGLGSMSGTIIAAVGWIFLLEGLRVVLPADVLDWRMVIYPLVLISMMLLRPQGLMGGIELGVLKPGRVEPLAKKEERHVRAQA